MSLLLKYLLEKKLIKSKEEIKHKTPLEIAREKLDYGEFKKIIKEIYKLKYIENPQINVDEELIKRLDKKIIEEYKVLPIARRGKFLIVSTLEPDKSNEILDIFKILFPQYYVEIILIDPLILSKEIKKYIGSEKEEKQTFKLENIEIEPLSEFIEEKREDVETLIKDTPIVRFLDKLFEESISKRATDIHIEPYENKLRVRFRIDGILHTILETSKTYHSGVVARIKSLANLDIGERRKIQDGRFEIKINNKVIDVRVSIIPSIFGEKAVLRLLDKERLEFSLDKLGFEEKSLKIVKEILKYPYGFILVTGPTGSGKTTTLYSMLSVLNKEDKHILTVEDPVEYYFKGINQVAVKEEIGLTYSKVLRAFLRQAPDIIMIGEIRDEETAQIAFRAALTGHLVLSTLHTYDTISTVERLIDLGVKPYLISSTLNLIISQRLVRTICPYCKEEDKIGKNLLEKMGVKIEFPIYKGKGCSYCMNTGHLGRIGIFEVLPVNDKLKEIIQRGKIDKNELKKIALESGMITLKQSLISKLKKGIISAEEVIKILSEISQ